MSQDCVVLLHGLARSEISLTPMQIALENEGYKVVNRGYPSTEATIQELVDDYVTEDVAACGDAKVQFRDPFDGRDSGPGLADEPPPARWAAW